MPGVPSSKGCEGCRKQKKKCDQEEPACSRCRRLNIPCLGTGQQRYMFKHTNGPFGNVAPGASTTLVMHSQQNSVPRSPSNDVTLLTHAFLDTIKATTSIKFNLIWSFGIFLRYVPQRIGANAALDAAVNALVSAHRNLCSKEPPSISSITKYSRALEILRVQLDDPVKARSVETLCAVMILLTGQTFIGAGKKWTSHFEGAAQILKARIFYDPNDEFECALLLSLRGPVLLGAIFSPVISFTPQEWQTIIVNKLDGKTPEGQMMLTIAQLPVLLKRGKSISFRADRDPELFQTFQNDYAAMKPLLHGLRMQITRRPDLPWDMSEFETPVKMLALFQRTLGLSLAIALFFNLLLRFFKPANSLKLEEESEEFVREILELEPFANRWRPLGGGSICIALSLAQVGTRNQLWKEEAKRLLEKYQSDFPRSPDSGSGIEETMRSLYGEGKEEWR